MSASATKKKYAGPEPERPVTGSNRRSGSRTTVPTAAHDLLGPGQVGRGGVRSPRKSRDAGPDEGRRVGHGPHHRGLPAQSGLQAQAGDAGHDGQQARHPDGPEDPAGPFGHVRLDGEHGPGAADRRRRGRSRAASSTRTPGNSAVSSWRRAADVSATATCSGATHPEARSPPNRALPILPPPTMSRVCAMGGGYRSRAGRFTGGAGGGTWSGGPGSWPSGSDRRRRAPKSRRSGPARHRRSGRPGPCPPGRRHLRGRG